MSDEAVAIVVGRTMGLWRACGDLSLAAENVEVDKRTGIAYTREPLHFLRVSELSPWRAR